MDALVFLIVIFPLIAALVLGAGALFGVLSQERHEPISANIASAAMLASMISALTLFWFSVSGNTQGFISGVNWLKIDDFVIGFDFYTDSLHTGLAALFSTLLFVIMRFSVNYVHQEAGYHRFFFIFSLFACAILLLVLAANAVLTFIGWELAGLSSYLLIAFAYDRPVAAKNATRALITNRIGDTGFILAIGLSYSWLGSMAWQDIVAADQLSYLKSTFLSLCFLVAAFAKSAQLPFSGWLPRAMEGPTPSSAAFYGAIMIHSGVYLVIQLQPLLQQSGLAMSILALVGLFSALYGFIVGLTQTDIKSSLAFATITQLGLMFLECGLGLWTLATWHLAAHAVVRGYMILTAPSLMHNSHGLHIRPISQRWVYRYRLFTLSLQRMWLDQICDWALVKPIQRLGHDLSYFDANIVDPVMGSPAPAIRKLSSYAEEKEAHIGAQLANDSDRFSQGSGLANILAGWFATLVHALESFFVSNDDSVKKKTGLAQLLGYQMNKIENILLNPRYLTLFVVITLLLAF